MIWLDLAHKLTFVTKSVSERVVHRTDGGLQLLQQQQLPAQLPTVRGGVRSVSPLLTA
jgi:hypothetical protein